MPDNQLLEELLPCFFNFEIILGVWHDWEVGLIATVVPHLNGLESQLQHEIFLVEARLHTKSLYLIVEVGELNFSNHYRSLWYKHSEFYGVQSQLELDLIEEVTLGFLVTPSNLSYIVAHFFLNILLAVI